MQIPLLDCDRNKETSNKEKIQLTRVSHRNLIIKNAAKKIHATLKKLFNCLATKNSDKNFVQKLGPPTKSNIW